MTYSDGYVYKGKWKNGIQEGEEKKYFQTVLFIKAHLKIIKDMERKHANGRWLLI